MSIYGSLTGVIANTVIGVMLFMSVGLAWSNTALDKLAPKEIARLYYTINDGKSQVSLQVLSTCRYAKKNKKRACIEKPRTKVIEAVRKDYGETGKDKRSVSILTDPPAERGVGFLQYDYEAQDKEADQWIYLSALGKVKRVVSGNEGEPKEGSFFGSEFSYEDLEEPHIDDYNYRLLDVVTYQGRRCWVLEVVPTEAHAPSTHYSKTIYWIDQERYLRLKAVQYDRQGKRVKRLIARRVKHIDGVWIPLILNIDNLQSRRMSTIKIKKTAFDIGVDDEFLTLRTLTDGAFREQRLVQYRTHVE